MKRTISLLTFTAVSITGFLVACTGGPKGINPAPISQDSLVKRGDYLVTAMGCDDCHSTKKMGPHGPEVDMEHRYGGHIANSPIGKVDPETMKNGWILFSMDQTATVGPWGMSFSANISSDPTGIGNWTEAQFINALRNGKSKGLNEGRPILPPMPWPSYSKLSNEDLSAIFAYLKSTPPVKNLVPGPIALQDIK